MISDPTAFPIEFDPRVQRMRGTTRLGNKSFDVPFVSQIEGNLWTGGCANGLVLPPQFDHLISLYMAEAYRPSRQLKTVSLHWLLDDDKEPVSPMIEPIAEWAAWCVKDGPTLIHCQAGLNRSSLVACRTLMKLGHSVDEAIRLIRTRRSDACLSNERFEAWLRSL